MGEEPVEEGDLGFFQFEAGLGDGEEADLVDFGEGLEVAGADGPFGGEGVAGMGVAFGHVACAGPGVDGLAAFLKDVAQGNEWAAGVEAGFFAEFALGGSEEVFALVGFPFWNGPVAVVFTGEERSAGMGEEDFGLTSAEAVEEQAGRYFGTIAAREGHSKEEFDSGHGVNGSGDVFVADVAELFTGEIVIDAQIRGVRSCLHDISIPKAASAGKEPSLWGVIRYGKEGLLTSSPTRG